MIDNNNSGVGAGDGAGDGAGADSVKLKRRLNLSHSCAVICGSVIGMGIFISPAGVAMKAQSGGLTILIWTAAGLVSLLGSLVYIELGLTYPKSGGCYEYLNQMYGKYVAFLFSWMMSTFAFPGGMAIKILMLSDYLIQPFIAEPPTGTAFIVGVVVGSLLIVLNTVTVKWSARGQTLLSVLSVVALIVVIGIGFAFASTGRTDNGWNLGFQNSSTNVGDWCVAFFSASFAFCGYNSLNFLAEEIIEPKKNLPRAMIISIAIITGCYVCTNISYLSVLGMETLITSRVVVLDFALKTFSVLGIVFSLLIAFINMGSFNVSVLLASRIIYVGGRDNVFPRVFGLVSINYNTPMIAIIALWMMIIVYCSFDLFFILNNIMLVYWLFEFLVVAGLIYQRHKVVDQERPIQFYQAVHFAYAGSCFALVLFSAIFEPMSTLLGLLIVFFTGTPYYLVVVQQVIRLKKMDKLADKILVLVQKITFSVAEDSD